MNRRIVALLLTGVVLSTSCKKKLDIIPPDVEYITINGADKTYDEIILNAGTFYSYGYRVNDNSGIDQIEIKVKKGFNYESNVETFASDWFFGNTFTYDQKSKTDAQSFNPPANVTAGTYRLMVKPSDNDNNNNVERYLNFIIVNGKQPNMDVSFSSTIDGTGPVYEARRGDNLKFQGTVTSLTDITKVKVEMLSETKSVFNKVYDFPGTTDLAVDLKTVSDSLKCFVDPILGRGYYKMLIQTADANGQTAVKVFKVQVDF